MLRCMVFDLCRMLTRGERRNDFVVWTVRTHLFRVRWSSHVPSPLRRPQQQRLTVSVPPGNTKLGLGGERQTRFDRRFDRSPGFRGYRCARVMDCGSRCTLHRQGHCGALAPVYSSGVWSVVCVVCLFTYHFSGGEPVSATRTFSGICSVRL